MQLLGMGMPGTHGLRPLEVREVVGRAGVKRLPDAQQGRGRVRGGLQGMLRTVKRITVKRVAGKHYPEIVGYELGDFPENSPANNKAENMEDFEDFDDLPF